MRLALLGNRFGFHRVDPALEIFSSYFEDFHFFHSGQDRGQSWSSSIYDFNEDRLHGEVLDHLAEFDVVFLRMSHFDHLLRAPHVFETIAQSMGKKIIVGGYHCHTDVAFEGEKLLFKYSDRFVFLNRWARNYFWRRYPASSLKRYTLIPSLYLPSRNWYDRKLARRSGPPKVAIVGRKTRLPKGQSEGRWNYVSAVRHLLLASPDCEIHFFGDFENAQARNSFFDFFPSVIDRGSFAEDTLVDALQEMDFGLINGFVSPRKKNDFEAQNFPARLTTFIKAGVEPLVFRGTSWAMEEWVHRFNFGRVLHPGGGGQALICQIRCFGVILLTWLLTIRT